MSARRRTGDETGPSRSLLALAVAGALAASLGGSTSAQTSPSWPPASGLEKWPEDLVMATQPGPAGADHARFGRFVAGNPAWSIWEDPLSGSLRRAYGPGLALPEAHGGEGLVRRIERWLGENADLVSVPPEALAAAETAHSSLSPIRWITLEQTHDGLPVVNAGLTLALRDERIVYVASRSLAPVRIQSKPSLTAAEALAVVPQVTGAIGLRSLKVPELAFAPRLMGRGASARLGHDLVWRLLVLPEGRPRDEAWFAWVDALNGRLVAFFPDGLSTAACEADPAQALGQTRGGIRPDRADDAEQVRVLPFARVTKDGILGAADRNGAFAYSGESTSCSLAGARFLITCDECASQPSAPGDPGGLADFGTGGGSDGFPVFGNGTSTPADRTGFYQLQQARELLAKWDVAAFSDVEVAVNSDSACGSSACQACSFGYGLSFVRKGAGCNNTGEIRDVLHHELGHTWDRTDGNGITQNATSEWKGDLLAVLAGGDSCIGESFHLTGGPTSTCSGVRDLDELATGRDPSDPRSHAPGNCATCPTITRTINDCGGQSHCVGEIPGQTLWHLKKNLEMGADYITGVPFAAGNPALSSAQARWLLEKLFLLGGPSIVTFNPVATSVSIYDAIMVQDDDNGNLADGVPHGAYINAAFTHHELNESVLIPDSANCPAPADPLVTASVESDPESGRPRVRLAWSGGGPLFDVYRNHAANETFLPLARGVSGGPVFDEGIVVGETVRYFVASVSSGPCEMISPGANVVTLTVGAPEVRFKTMSVSEVPGTGDGDGLLEPGETASLLVTLEETGGGAGATGLSASLSSPDARAAIVSSGPVSFGSIGAGGTAVGAAPFSVAILPDTACGASVFLQLSVSGTQGCWLDGLRLPIAGPPCQAAPGGFVRPVMGSLAGVADSGDQDLIADNCEITSFSYQVANVGSETSGPVTATVESLTPEVLVVSGSSFQLPNLDPGETATPTFSVDTASASAGQSLAFRVSADSAANPAPAALVFTTLAEQNPRLFGTLGYSFESSFEGWTSEGFDRSTVRAAAGVVSVHAGSTTQSVLCRHLTSPAIRLAPTGFPFMTLRVFANIEPFTDAWYDRANVHVIDAVTGVHTPISPISGVGYNASGGPPSNLCHIAQDQGWAGSLNSFGMAQFDLSPWAGKEIRLEFNYGSDEGDNREGVYIDDVVVASASLAEPDLQSNACDFAPEVSAPGAVIPLQVASSAPGVALSWQDLGAGFTYNVYAGTVGSWYNHGATNLACASAGVACNGMLCSLGTGALPPGTLYFLVTATRGGREGPSGFASSGLERNPAQNTCP